MRNTRDLPARIGPFRRATTLDRDESGFTLIELLVTLSVATLGYAGVVACFLASSRSNDETFRMSQALHSLRSIAEEIRSTPFDQIVNNFQDQVIEIPLLDEGLCTVNFLLDETDMSPLATEFGFPRDLDGDGQANKADVSGGYNLLAAQLTLTWIEGGTEATKLLTFMLAQN